MRESAVLCATIRNSHSWSTEWKKLRMSASSTQFTSWLMSPYAGHESRMRILRRTKPIGEFEQVGLIVGAQPLATTACRFYRRNGRSRACKGCKPRLSSQLGRRSRFSASNRLCVRPLAFSRASLGPAPSTQRRSNLHSIFAADTISLYLFVSPATCARNCSGELAAGSRPRARNFDRRVSSVSAD